MSALDILIIECQITAGAVQDLVWNVSTERAPPSLLEPTLRYQAQKFLSPVEVNSFGGGIRVQ